MTDLSSAQLFDYDYGRVSSLRSNYDIGLYVILYCSSGLPCNLDGEVSLLASLLAPWLRGMPDLLAGLWLYEDGGPAPPP